MAETQTCPCGSGVELKNCCLPLIQGKAQPKTAEALLKARYVAFTTGDVDYIMQTHHTRTVADIKREEVEEWAKGSEWIGIKVLQKEAGGAGDDKGTVTFHAQYRAEGKVNDHYEHSLFEKEGGNWKFLDAQALKPGPIKREGPKVGRNDPCPCGSGQKYKKCHGTADAAQS